MSDGGATIPSSGGSREERLARLMADYSDHLNAGEPLDPEQIISEHPDLAQELKAALSALATVDSSVDPVLPQANLGDFRLIREVGRGGMGVVYEAWQNSMDRRVALKVLPFALLSNPKAVARFELEAKVGGRLEHPSIVSVYGKGIEGGAPYYAMEFVEGETLEEILRRLRPSPLESGGGPWKPLESFSRFLKTRDGGTPTAAVESPSRSPVHARQPGPREESRFDSEVIDLKYCLNVAEVFAEVADGLQYAHQRGVIHRDLKPQNLILDRKGKLRILDFGLARLEGHEGLTVSGEFLGTPLYMSPEQAMAHRVPLDHRTDIYSLGATLYEVLTRRPPFRGKDYKETLSQIITRDPPLPRRLNGRIPKGLETITLKCLRKDPGGRYGTAEALAQDLRRFVRGDPIEARPQAVVERVARRAWRNRWPAAVVLGAALLLLTSGLVIRQRSAEARIRKEDLYSQGVLAAVMKIQLGRPAVRPDPRINEGEPRKGPAGARELELLDLAWPDPVEEAVQELERVAALFPRRPDGFYHRARGLWLLGRGPNALEEVDRALASDPGFVPALVLKSVIQKSAVDGAPPAAALDGAGGGSRPDWAGAWLSAHRASSGKRWKEAAEAYSALLAYEAAGQRAYLGSSMEALLGRGRARLESEDWDGALEDFAAARALWPALMEPVLFLGKTYLLKGNAARCEELFQGLYDRDRARDEVAIRVGTIYRELGDLSRGLAWAERASRSAAREVLRSSFLFRMGKLEEAAAAAEEALKLEPGNKKAHNTLGNALARQGKIDEAVAAYQEAIRLDPRSAAAYTNLGEAERLRGNLEEAVTAQSEAIRFEPSSATAHHNLGITLRGLGRLGDAAAELRRALELDPRAARTHNSLANVLYAQKKVEEATREFREAIRLEPRYMTARFNLGRALAEEGESEQAFEVLKEALSISDGSSSSDAAPTVSRPTLTHLLDDLSKLAVKVGRKEEALAYGKRLLELKRERAGRARAGVQELNEYAWALLTVEPAVLRDPQAGLAAAKEAAERSRGKDPASLDTLALAHFLTGDLGSAVEAEEKAIQLMPASREGGGSSDQRAELEENLKRYRTALAAGVKTAVPGKAGGSP